MWQRSSSPCVEKSRLKSSSADSVRQIARLALYSGHGLGRVVVGPHDLGVTARSAAPDVVALEDGDVGDAVVRREVVREGQPVHPAADDDDVVARREVAPLEERPVAEQPGHAGTSVARASSIARVRTCSRQYAGTRSRRPSGSRRIFAPTRATSPWTNPSGVGTSKPDRYDNASSASSPTKSQARPAVGDVEDEGVAVDRGDPVLELPTDVRDHSGLHDHQRLVGGKSQRAGAVAGGHEPVQGGGLGRADDHADGAVAELRHAGAPPRGRRRGSARRTR